MGRDGRRLGPKLPQMVVEMEVGMPHTLGPGELSKDRMRCKLALPSTEAFQQNAQLLYIGFEAHRSRTAQLLVHLWTCLDTVWPLPCEPQRPPFE